jgi:hypothetical protein
MGSIKNYAGVLFSLLVALIVLHFVLKLAKKAPVVGGIAEKAEELAFEG